MTAGKRFHGSIPTELPVNRSSKCDGPPYSYLSGKLSRECHEEPHHDRLGRGNVDPVGVGNIGAIVSEIGRDISVEIG